MISSKTKTHWIGINQRVDFAAEFNKYYAFRRDYILDKDVDNASISITADSRYILYINGVFVGRGPSRCNPKNQSFETYNIKTLFKRGVNTIAVLVHRFGISTGQYINRGRTGLIIYGEILNSDRSKIIIKTDLNWYVREADWFLQTKYRITQQLGFQEFFDARKEPKGWEVNPTDEQNHWRKVWFLGPVGIFPWLKLEPSGLKPLVEEEIKGNYILFGKYKAPDSITIDDNIINYWIDGPLNKINILESDKDGWISTELNKDEDLVVSIDFGFCFTGFPIVETKKAESGEFVDIFYHTSLDEKGVPEPNKGFGEPYEGIADRFICRKGQNIWKPFSNRGFRFLTCIFRGFKDLKFRINSIDTHYPVEEVGQFKCSDEIFKKIWNVSVRTLKSTMLDAHVDNPWREQGQYIHDSCLAALGAITTFGKADLWRRGLIQWGYQIYPEGFINPLAPSEESFINIIDFSFEWVSGLWLYILYTGDVEIIKYCLKPLKTLLDSSEKLITEEGLFIPPEGYWYHIDWADIDRRHYSLSLNLVLLKAYEDAIKIFRLNKDKNRLEKYEKISQSLRKILESRFWSENSACWREYFAPNKKVQEILNDRIQPPNWPNEDFLKRKFTGIGSLHGNTLALFLDIGSKEQQSGALKYIKKAFNENQREVNFFSPVYTEKIFGALFKAGENNFAIENIKKILGREISIDGSTWPEIFKHGMDLIRTGYRDWPVSGYWAGSQEVCSSINFVLHKYILGLNPIKPGFKEFSFKPCLGQLNFVNGSVPSPEGIFKINCYKKNGKIIGEISIPSKHITGIALGTKDGDLAIEKEENKFIWSDD